MMPYRLRRRLAGFSLILCLLQQGAAQAQDPPAPLAAVGTPPAAAAVPHLHFAFEFRVTLAPVVVVGETALGHRQYIGITGGSIAGPKLTGEVVPGGWDYQLGLADHCNMLSADYFIRAEDGTLIHVLNEGTACAPRPGEPRAFFRPRFEAPQGPHEWMTHATFVATLELEPPAAATGPAPKSPAPMAIRLKFYQVE